MRAVLIAAAMVAGCGSRASEPAAVVIALPGNASGAWWDATTSSLYVTQDHAIVRWSNGELLPVAEVPGAKGLGAIVKLADGRLVVTAFGFGNEGGIYIVASGTVTTVPALDPKRRRTGLALAPDGALYVSYFFKEHDGTSTGGIATVDLASGETDVVTTGLLKPVGLAATKLALFATDQEAASLVSYSRADPSSSAVVTHDLAEPDLMAILPNGDLAIASKTGVVYRVTPAGGPREIAHGLGQIRGVAYDPVGKRLFVVERGEARSGATGTLSSSTHPGWPHFSCRSASIVSGDLGAVIECRGVGPVLELIMSEEDLVETRPDARFTGMPSAMGLVILHRALWPMPREQDRLMSVRVT